MALRVVRTIGQVPWTVWAFAAIHFGSLAYLALLPGLPEADRTSLPWGIAFSAVLIILIARGSPSAWGITVAVDTIMFGFLIIPIVNSPSQFKPWGALVLQGAALAALLSRPTSSHVRRHPFTVGELLIGIALLAVLLASMAQAERSRRKSFQDNQQQDQLRRQRAAASHREMERHAKQQAAVAARNATHHAR